MRTDDLIANLAGKLAPVKRGAAMRRLLLTVTLGIAASAAVMLLVLGPRHHFAAVMQHSGMWMKLAYTFALAAFGLWLVERAGRPGARLAGAARLLALPLLAIALLAGLQLAQPGADGHGLMLGHSSRVCAVLIVMVALPTLLAAFWGLRQLAPTRLGLAGAAAGLFAGAAGAFVYAFHCTEEAAPFVAIWYTAGIALTAAIGAFAGRWALRW
jgi:hypothetical protein